MDGKKLREVRFTLGLTQKEFADRIGLQQSYISLMETGAKLVSDKTEFKVKRLLNQ
ncbi:helix-turn-helix transcriptional regulator [Ornithinibacillus sp. FSL M8-0202]|uniref:helix-turn-helix transcriptional regulator n=1 Tax=Ornithinibacillus sp. FSL M8-0202 TaxID=2921616 RepID=UPI0030D05406